MEIEILEKNKVLIKFEDNTVFYEGDLIEANNEIIKIKKDQSDWCNPHINYLENTSKKNKIIYRKATEKDLDKINILNFHRYFDKKFGEEVVLEKIISVDSLVVVEDEEAGLIVGFKDYLKKQKFIIHTYRGLNIEKAI